MRSTVWPQIARRTLPFKHAIACLPSALGTDANWKKAKSEMFKQNMGKGKESTKKNIRARERVEEEKKQGERMKRQCARQRGASLRSLRNRRMI